MHNTNKSPAELKVALRSKKILWMSVTAALLIILTALLTTEFKDGALISAELSAVLVLIVTLVCVYLFMLLAKAEDEFEKAIQAKLTRLSLYSSMLLLPWTFLHKLGFLPELNVYYGFMFMWFIYFLGSIYYGCFNKI